MTSFDPPGRFTKCPTHMSRETAQSYLGRLTAFFGAESHKHFCQDYMLDLKGIQHGEPEALHRLSAMTGANAQDLARWTPRRITKEYMELGGEMIHNKLNPRHLISLCPVCAREDIAANPTVPLDQAVYGRCEWMLGVVSVCARHKVKLVSHRAPMRTAERIDVGYETGYLLEELQFVEPEPSEPDDFQLYLLARIGVGERRHSDLLDPLPLARVTQLCGAIGMDLLRRRGADKAATDDQRRAAGFEMLGHGVEQFERMFLQLREGILLNEMTASLVPTLLEYLYDSELAGRDLAGFVDVFVDICFRSLPYGEGTVLLGRRCPRRTLHDVPSAIASYGIGPHHLNAFLRSTPELIAYAGERDKDCLIRVDVADRLFSASMPFITQTEVARRLGRNPRSVPSDLWQFIDAGIIPAESGVTASGVAFYSEPQLNAAMASFLGRFEITHTISQTMRTTEEISMAYRIAYRDLWRMLGNGDIKRIGHIPDEGLIRGIRLEVADVLEALTGVADALTTNQAADILGVINHDVSNLAVNGKLPTLPLRSDIPTKLLHVFDAAVIKSFDAEYMSRTVFCKLLGRQLSVETLRARGLKPAIELDSQFTRGARAVFYRREEAVRFIAAA